MLVAAPPDRSSRRAGGGPEPVPGRRRQARRNKGMAEAQPDPFKDIIGVDFDPARLGENLQAFMPILDEIKKLRNLDLTEVHPAVIFDPAQGYEP
jgi:hypothetical protein